MTQKEDISENEDRSIVLTSKIDKIFNSNELNLKEILKLRDNIRVRVKENYNLTQEILTLLIKLINEFKIEFFTQKNLVTLDSLLASCDMLIAKTESILGECLKDTYSSDKLKCFHIINENIELLSLKFNEKYANCKNSLNMYKNMGPEFDSILASYIQLKKKLDEKKSVLDKMKDYDF